MNTKTIGMGTSIGKSIENSDSLTNDYAESFENLENNTPPMNKTTTSTPSSSKFSQKKKNFRSMNLELDAPQWTDFISASPQVSCDDYFSKWHDENEYKENENLSMNSCTNDSPYKEKKSFNCSVNASFKETTYENVLTEAMNNLQMSVKMNLGNKSINKLCLVESPTVKSLNKRFTRSICSEFDKSVKFKDHGRTEEKENCSITRCLTPANKKKHVKRLSSQQLLKVDSTTEYKSPESDKILHTSDSNNDSHESPLTDQSLQLNLEVTATSTEHEVSEEKLEPELEANKKNESSNNIEESKVKSDANIPKSKIVTSFGTQQAVPNSNSKTKVTVLTGTAWHRQVKRRMSLNNLKQLSGDKNKAVESTKYVSTSEAVSKFQRLTPQRFHTVSKKTTKIDQLRRTSFKLTKAVSPALICKTRTRPVTAISRKEQEDLELQQFRQNQIKANPVRKDILKRSAPLKKVEKKIVTNPQPFNLTETKKNQIISKPNQEVKGLPAKRIVPTIVDMDEKGVVIKEEEVLNFGIPCTMKKKNTKVVPFSFEARNKELQMKKQEKLKEIEKSKQQELKGGFHARPVPAAVKTPVNKKLVKNTTPKVTVPRSLGLEQRHKEMQKRKEEKIKQILEEEKQTRPFRAQKVPEFKPVMVRGRSRDNFRSNENLSVKSDSVKEIKPNSKVSALKRSEENLAKTKNLIKKPLVPDGATKKLNPPSTLSTMKQTNKIQSTAPKMLEPKCKLSQKSVAVLTELNSDKRAKQRKEIDEQLKKQMDEQVLKKRNISDTRKER